MRAREFIKESYEGELNSDLFSILAKARETGFASVNTSDIVNKMASKGYSITVDGLLNLLNDENSTQPDEDIINIQHIISNATPDNITFARTNSGVAAVDDSGDKVKALAMKAAKKEM